MAFLSLNNFLDALRLRADLLRGRAVAADAAAQARAPAAAVCPIVSLEAVVADLVPVTKSEAGARDPLPRWPRASAEAARTDCRVATL